MKLKQLSITALLLALMATVLPSCLDSNDENTTLYQSIVTFTGNRDNRIYFEYRELEDSPTITLYTTGSIDETTTPAGTRLFISYTLPENMKYGQSGPINIIGNIQKLNKSSVEQAPSNEAQASNAGIHLLSLYRSGNYLNMYATMPEAKDREFVLVADESTLDSDMPELYLTARGDASAASLNVTCIASIDIEHIWYTPGINGIKVYVNNTANPIRKVFEFKK